MSCSYLMWIFNKPLQFAIKQRWKLDILDMEHEKVEICRAWLSAVQLSAVHIFCERWGERETISEMSAELSAERYFLLNAELSATLGIAYNLLRAMNWALSGPFYERHMLWNLKVQRLYWNFENYKNWLTSFWRYFRHLAVSSVFLA